ncbi:MAG: hypothetical protein Fur0032_07320 [Terrimicrobiaceae bacterium]
MKAAPVYYLGPEGTFSHILALRYFGRKVLCEQRPTLESVVEGLAAGPSHGAAVLPVENSSGGTVPDSIDTLIRHAGRIHVVEEIALDVRIALLGTAGGEPRVIYSHFTQIKHHGDWLRTKFPHARLVAVESTAVAADRAGRSHSAAAMAAPGAAALYGLDVLARPPGGNEPNVTHFYILRNGAPPTEKSDVAGGAVRTALVAALPNVCGSLHAFLAPFARHGISLTRIVSRPVRGHPQTYVFFVEIEGDPGFGLAQKAVRRASQLAESLVSLGAFPSGRRVKS